MERELLSKLPQERPLPGRRAAGGAPGLTRKRGSGSQAQPVHTTLFFLSDSQWRRREGASAEESVNSVPRGMLTLLIVMLDRPAITDAFFQCLSFPFSQHFQTANYTT